MRKLATLVFVATLVLDYWIVSHGFDHLAFAIALGLMSVFTFVSMTLDDRLQILIGAFLIGFAIGITIIQVQTGTLGWKATIILDALKVYGVIMLMVGRSIEKKVVANMTSTTKRR